MRPDQVAALLEWCSRMVRIHGLSDRPEEQLRYADAILALRDFAQPKPPPSPPETGEEKRARILDEAKGKQP